MGTTLYIIGNGFDLHHGFKSRFVDFQNFLDGQHINDKHANLQWDFEEYFDFERDRSYLWLDFERDLGTFIWQNFLSDSNNLDENSEPADFFGLEDEMDSKGEELVNSIKEALLDWLLEIEEPSSSQLSQVIIRFEERAQFLTFNYTDTLESIYGISDENILYIHGRCSDGVPDNLVLGHSAELEDSYEFPENYSRISNSESSAKSVLYMLQKRTDDLINENKSWFSSLSGIRNVFVLGHSLSPVDRPYFAKIAQVAPDAHWSISYHSVDDIDRNRKFIAEMGLSPARLSNIKIADLT